MASIATGSVSIGAWPTPGTTRVWSLGALTLHPGGDVGRNDVGQVAADQQGRALAGEPAEQQSGDPERRPAEAACRAAR